MLYQIQNYSYQILLLPLLLELLVKNPDKVYSREKLLNLVWGSQYPGDVRTVDVHIARLRKKLGNCGEWIINRSGYGYCLHI